MSEKFSPALRIADLNDFIAPSQACIVSLKGLKANTTKPDKAEVLLRTSLFERVILILADSLFLFGFG